MLVPVTAVCHRLDPVTAAAATHPDAPGQAINSQAPEPSRYAVAVAAETCSGGTTRRVSDGIRTRDRRDHNPNHAVS